jgi:hypothetical protein
VSTVIALVACEVAEVSDTEADCESVEVVAASVRICVDICEVVAGLAKLAGCVLLSTDCPETPTSELLAVGDSLVLLCIGTSIGAAVDASVGPPVESTCRLSSREEAPR